MTDKKENESKRRKLLKSVAAGGGAIIAGKTLPENWARPAVESVILPAHAQTSGTFAGALMASLDSDSMLAKAMESLIPSAQAQRPQMLVDVSWCVFTNEGSNTSNVKILFVDAANDPPCWAEMCSDDSVGWGNPARPLMSSDGCNNGWVSKNWFENMGLVKDAQASASCLVTLQSPSASGQNMRIQHMYYGIDRTISLEAAPCGPASVECSRDKSCD